MITSIPRRSRRVLLCGAIALSGLGLAGFTLSGTANAAGAPAGPSTTVPTPVTTIPVTDAVDTGATDAGNGTWTDDTDWVAADNAEQDQLASYLTAHNIGYTIETEDVSHWVVIDYNDQAASDAVDDFYWALYPTPQEEIDAENADTDALAAFLQDRGIEVTVTTDRHGFRDAEWNYDDHAASDAVDDYYWQQDPISPADIASMNAETEAENAYLTSHGFTATITTDRHGIETDEYDYNDDSVYQALDAFWSTYDWSE